MALLRALVGDNGFAPLSTLSDEESEKWCLALRSCVR